MKRNENIKLIQKYHDQAKTKLLEEYQIDQFRKWQGEYKFWFEDGQIGIISNFKDGRWHGKRQYWWSDGIRYFIDSNHFKKGEHGTKIEFNYGK